MTLNHKQQRKAETTRGGRAFVGIEVSRLTLAARKDAQGRAIGRSVGNIDFGSPDYSRGLRRGVAECMTSPPKSRPFLLRAQLGRGFDLVHFSQFTVCSRRPLVAAEPRRVVLLPSRLGRPVTFNLCRTFTSCGASQAICIQAGLSHPKAKPAHHQRPFLEPRSNTSEHGIGKVVNVQQGVGESRYV